MTERELTTLREILGRIARRAEHKPDLELIKRLAIEADELIKNCSIPNVVGQSEQLKAEVFTLANKLAVSGEGDAAVAMHRIHNRL